MKRLAFLTLLFVFLTTNFFAQTTGYESGTYGQFYSGTTYMSFNGLRTYLNHPTALERLRVPYTLYTQVGGEWMVVSDRVMLGSGVSVLTSPRINVDSVEFDINGWGGYIKLGYHYLQTTNAFAYSFLGFGLGGSSLTLSNLPASSTSNTAERLDNTLTYANTLYFVDAGTGYKLVFTPDGNENIGGFTIGIDGGCKLYISRNAARNIPNETKNARFNSSRTVFVPYVQMTVGLSRLKPKQTFGK